MIIEIILIVLTALLVFFYLNGQYNESYWRKRGVKFHSKNTLVKVLGPFWDYVTGRRPLFEIYGDLYKQYEKEPAVGVGSFFTPSLFVHDPNNVTHVLQLDFNSFSHGGFENLSGDQLTESIPFLNGPKWKLMRQNMTPLFTGTKLKQMYYIMDKGAQDFVNYIKNDPERQKGNAYKTLINYCSAAITASVFGIGTDSIFDSPFVDVARSAIEPTFSRNVKFTIVNLSPWLTKLFGIKLFSEFEDFFIGAIKQMLDKRKLENVPRHDFGDLALNLQKNGTMRDSTTGCEMDPTVGLLSAQAFFFFLAGVEPSATVLYGTLIELGHNPDILEKVHKEIDEAFEKNNSTITYDVVVEMNYLERVLSESMRMYPPIGFLTRQCVQDTVLPVGNIKVSKGTKIATPVFHIHRDPKYYPEPEKFDPDRFTKDGQQPLSDAFYMPFGRGGRICIGARFARIQVKAGLVHLLRNFTVKTIDYEKISFRKEMFAARPENVDVQFIPRDIKT